MTPRRARLGLAAFAVLTGALAANVFVLQPPGRRLPAIADHRSDETLGTWLATGTVTREGTTSPQPTPTAAAGGSELTRAIQRELKAKGYETGPLDGVATPVTQAAIMAYEADNGLTLTATPREALLQHILLGASSDAPSQQQTQPSETTLDLVRTVQVALAKLGYAPGSEDGRLSEETIRAIRKFESDQRMKVTGRISGELVAKIATPVRLPSQ